VFNYKASSLSNRPAKDHTLSAICSSRSNLSLGGVTVWQYI